MLGRLRLWVAVFLAILMGGCGSGAAENPSIPAYAAESRPMIQKLLADTLTPGAVVLVRSPQGDWSEAFGTTTRGGAEPMRANDHLDRKSVV